MSNISLPAVALIVHSVIDIYLMEMWCKGGRQTAKLGLQNVLTIVCKD